MMIYDNVFKDLEPAETMTCRDFTLNSNFYENYLDYYPDATNDGIYWNQGFSNFDFRPMCKNPLDPLTPAVPNFNYTTSMTRLTNENKFPYFEVYQYDKYDFNNRLAYVVHDSDVHYVYLRWECLNTDKTNVYYEVYLNEGLLIKTEKTEYTYKFDSIYVFELNFKLVAVCEPNPSEYHKSQARTIHFEVFRFSNPQPQNQNDESNNTIDGSILGIPLAGIICLVWVYLKKNRMTTSM